METKKTELKWDGSHLGTWSLKDIEISKDPDTIWLIKATNTRVTAVLNKNSYPCIVDELKPLFGLVKVGTHMVCLKGKSYLLRPLRTGKEVTVKDVEHDKLPAHLRAQIQDIYAFRFLVGVKQSFDKHIYIRTNEKGQKYALSYCEATQEEKAIKSLCKTVIDRWFGNSDLNKVIGRILQCGENSSVKIMAFYRGKINETIYRINKDLILLEDDIARKIHNALT